MLIVAVGLLASGKIRTRSPFERSYSVIPSTVAPFVTPCGSCAESGAAASASMRARRRPVRMVVELVMGPLLLKKAVATVKAGARIGPAQVAGVFSWRLFPLCRGFSRKQRAIIADIAQCPGELQQNSR